MNMIKQFVEFLEERDVHNVGEDSLVLQLEREIVYRNGGYRIPIEEYFDSTESYIEPDNYFCVIFGGKSDMSDFWKNIDEAWRDECKKLRETDQYKFIEFLKENHIYKRFRLYFKDFNPSLDFNKFLSSKKSESYIVAAFSWAHTDEGTDFWNDIHKKWILKSSKKYCFKVEIKGLIECNSVEEARSLISHMYEVCDGHTMEISLEIADEKSE